MGETTIQWTATRGPDGILHPGFTHNAWIGCTEVDPDPDHPGGPSECDNCYARNGSKRLGAQHHLKLWPSHHGDGDPTHFFTGEDYQRKPFAWNRKAEKLGVRLKVFAASYSDVGERHPELVERRQRLARTILETPWLDWLLLTKRPGNLVELFSPTWPGSWPSNAWAGTTVGLRPSLSRIDELRKVPASVRFLSMEPLLDDSMSLDRWIKAVSVCAHCGGEVDGMPNVCPACSRDGLVTAWGEDQLQHLRDGSRYSDPGLANEDGPDISWVIGGGESGSKARPFSVEGARRLRDECAQAGIPFFWKQMGAVVNAGGERDSVPPTRQWPSGTPFARPGESTAGWRALLRDGHGGDWAEWPEDCRVREWPASVCLNGAMQPTVPRSRGGAVDAKAAI